ncbi:arylsulfatase regulator [Peptoclostridium acidaminophilum DSM 3953]|uniref:Arylsulfatase regulator n=1 Tax=Peptoclostridium acidaminophilum DSM 3953 TaxID=1286171 RepID=W8TEN0_PEPAC|nr:thioether cross-link-forming SCIFF peptide maturase [Peptoclostridium acidaminophilum]AHM56268.1 arylsulfatase regulator [Peptoclostridium acidaminophilum DSM 3953]
MQLVHKFSLKGVNVALDVNSGAVHVVDNIVYEVLDYFGEKSIEQIIDILGEKYASEDIVQAYGEIDELKEQGLLYSQDTYEHNETFVNRKPVVKAMCLNVAHDCNLKCVYCFASQGDFGGERKLMPLEVGKKALEYLVANSGSRRNLEVDFFGGEPLMNWDVVKALVAYGNEIAEPKDKNFRFTITTNGILLDDEKIDFINKYMKNVVLSLDGRKDINDNMRITWNDKGSYDTIVPKFKKLVESRGEKEYFIRGTFTRHNLDFAKDVEHFASEGFNITSMEPAVDEKMSDFALTEEDLPRIFEEYENLVDFYIDKKLENEKFTFFHFSIDLSQGPCVIKRLTGCGAGSEYICVTPEGDIYPCHQFVGNEKFKMGSILDSDVKLDRDLQLKFQNAHVYAKEACRECWAKFYCSGGCHANAYNFNGDILKPYSMACEMLKKRVECAIAIKAKQMLGGEADDQTA